MGASAHRTAVRRRSAPRLVAAWVAATTVTLGVLASVGEVDAAPAQPPPNVLLVITDGRQDANATGRLHRPAPRADGSG
jgi:hypothetical protein